MHPSNLANNIDINQPVKQGEDVVISEDGNTHLGSYEEYDEKNAAGLVINANPDYKRPVSVQPVQHLDLEGLPEEASAASVKSKPKRDANGHFAKKETPMTPEETTPEETPVEEVSTENVPTEEAASAETPEEDTTPEEAPEAPAETETPAAE